MVPSKEGLYTQAVMLKWLTPKSNVIGKYLHLCNELNEYARVTRYRQYCPVYVILPHPSNRWTVCWMASSCHKQHTFYSPKLVSGVNSIQMFYYIENKFNAVHT